MTESGPSRAPDNSVPGPALRDISRELRHPGAKQLRVVSGAFDLGGQSWREVPQDPTRIDLVQCPVPIAQTRSELPVQIEVVASPCGVAVALGVSVWCRRGR